MGFRIKARTRSRRVRPTETLRPVLSPAGRRTASDHRAAIMLFLRATARLLLARDPADALPQQLPVIRILVGEVIVAKLNENPARRTVLLRPTDDRSA